MPAHTPKAPPRRETKSDRTRRRILDAAAQAFRRHGYASVTLKDIAAIAGLQAGSLYYHFASKDELVAAVLETSIRTTSDATRSAVEALGSGAAPLAKLRAAIAAHLRSALEEGDYSSAQLRILGQLPEEIRGQHVGLQRAYGAYWRGLLEEAVTAGAIRADLDLSILRMLILGALNWTVEWVHEGGATPAQIAAHASTMVLEGLGVGTKKRPR